ncbi:MOSC domain-containing protein [Acidisoma sp. C75]
MAGLILREISIYPVKSLGGLRREAARVEPWGLTDDRRWMVVSPAGRFLSQRELPRMARIRAEPSATGLTLAAPGRDGMTLRFPDAQSAPCRVVTVWSDAIPALDAGEAAAAWISTALGQPCRLVYLDDIGARPVDSAFGTAEDRVALADGFPLLLTLDASLAALNAILPAPVPMTRFRPNLVIEGGTAWEEDRWRRIRVGAVTFRVAKPCARCAITTVDQESGARPDKSEPLRTLGRVRRTKEGVIFGQNLIPDGPGEIAAGDEVEILEEGGSSVVLLPSAAQG